MHARPKRHTLTRLIVILAAVAGVLTWAYFSRESQPVEHKPAKVTGTEPGRDGRTWLLLSATDGQRYSFLIDADAAARCHTGRTLTIDVVPTEAGRPHASIPDDPCA